MDSGQKPHRVRRLSLMAPPPLGGGMTVTVEQAAEGVRRIEEAGFDYAQVGDTVWSDTYVQLALNAHVTKRLALLTTATNPVSRHPMVTASAIASVDEISGGRTNLGIGTGNSGVAMTGLPEPGWDQMRRAITIISSAHRRAREFEPWPAGVAIDESVMELQWIRRRVPILVCAGGPKGSKVAAEMGDGILLRAGDVGWAEFPGRLAHLATMRADGPRAGDPFEAQLTLPTYLTDSVEEGRRMLAPLVSAMTQGYASMTPSWIPPEYQEAWKTFRANYDFAHHVSSVDRTNSRLMDELGLSDLFYERYSFIGSEDAMVDRLFELQDMGFTAVTFGGGYDRDVANVQFERACSVRAKYLARLGEEDAAEGRLAAGAVPEDVTRRFEGPRAS